MLRINRELSVLISITMTAILFIAAIALAFFVPYVLEYMFRLSEKSGILHLAPTQRTMVYFVVYTELALTLLGLGMLFALLMLVLKKKVFSVTAVELIRYISWCLIFMGMVMISLAFCWTNALILAAILLFTGLTVRVVKNVIAEAVWLKEENDLTV